MIFNSFFNDFLIKGGVFIFNLSLQIENFLKSLTLMKLRQVSELSEAETGSERSGEPARS